MALALREATRTGRPVGTRGFALAAFDLAFARECFSTFATTRSDLSSFDGSALLTFVMAGSP